jgi:hypothetical protein
VALNNGVVGASLCKITMGVCNIDFIIIKSEFQKKGIGAGCIRSLNARSVIISLVFVICIDA